MQRIDEALKNDLGYLRNFVSRHKKVILIVLTILLLIICDLSPAGGNIQFYAKWIECGKKPVASDVSLKIGAHPKSYVYPSSITLLRFSPTYFCSPLEAEQAGYSADPNRYEFPHLKSNL